MSCNLNMFRYWLFSLDTPNWSDWEWAIRAIWDNRISLQYGRIHSHKHLKTCNLFFPTHTHTHVTYQAAPEKECARCRAAATTQLRLSWRENRSTFSAICHSVFYVTHCTQRSTSSKRGKTKLTTKKKKEEKSNPNISNLAIADSCILAVWHNGVWRLAAFTGNWNAQCIEKCYRVCVCVCGVRCLHRKM